MPANHCARASLSTASSGTCLAVPADNCHAVAVDGFAALSRALMRLKRTGQNGSRYIAERP